MRAKIAADANGFDATDVLGVVSRVTYVCSANPDGRLDKLPWRTMSPTAAKKSTDTPEPATTIIANANLRPAAGAKALGTAQFIERKRQTVINILAEGLPHVAKGSGYGVWLTGAGTNPLWFGYFQQVTTSGQAGAQSIIKVDPRDYDQVLITRQQGRNPTAPGTTILSGPIRLKD